MPAMLVFLLKVNIALILFCAGYYLVLRHLTFYTLNRIYLVSAILFASIYPKINLDSFAQRHQQLTQPVQVILNFEAPAQTFIQPIAKPDHWYWLEVVFWIGAALLTLRLLMQLYSLHKLYRNSRPATIHGHQVRTMSGDSGPFSFWKSIYINPNNHNPADLRSILLHEQVHVNQWHTLDILLAELSTIFYWFNPGIWLMKKAVRENIEFITDAKILNKGVDSREYQYSLVNVSFASGPQSIVNHFNLSTIKKRIIMMNAKRSSKFNLTRYAFLMPAVVALLLIFSVSKAAFVAKSDAVLHSIVNSIGSPSIQHDGLQNTALARPVNIAKAKKIKTAHVADTTKKIKHDPVIVIDTLKRTPGSHMPIYILNGKLIGRDDMDKISPDNIGSVNISKGDGNKQDVIYINTKDINGQAITAVKINGQRVNVVGGHGVVTVGSDSMHVVVDTARGRSGEVVVRGYGTSTARSANKLAGRLYGTTSYSYSSSSGAELNHLGDKMYVIDGKPATEKEVKKLSAFDIDKIVVKTDNETKSLYGEKAKNGVVFIVTKKK